ncbi:hypothetical protein [Dyadobacter sp. NIV53]|uniref:hypothetical protein n=1 Tax=Dyadobacter sp. NIV53 TaxID=2861765 RepID=UPI001C86B3DC|nr:hypothetical protein [Dyadobacter sp. NIV53]
MKNFTLIGFLIFVLITAFGFVSAMDLETGLVEISHAHNRLYFTRLHEKELPDSVLVRNINKAEVILKKAVGKVENGTIILIKKSRSEVYYLQGILAIRSHDLSNALNLLDSAASLNKNIKDGTVPVSISDLTFINNASVLRYRNAIEVTRKNILKMMIEDVYKNRNDQPETTTIVKIKELRKTLNGETFGENMNQDESVERMYTYLMLNYNAKYKICEDVLKYYNVLANGDYGIRYRNSHYIGENSELIGNELSQMKAETELAPGDYLFNDEPSDIDIVAAQSLARKNCPELFDDSISENYYKNALVGSSLKAQSLLILPKIPFTKSAWNKIPVNVNRFKNLGDLETFLDNNLKRRGYDNIKYYGFEDGFAIITPIEKFNRNGQIYEGEGRFSTSMSTSINSFFDYIDKLFLAEKGHYRFIILAAASNPYSLGKRPSLDYMESLVADGNNRLSEEMSQKLLNKRFSIDGYVYEFEQKEFASDPVFVKEPTLTGKKHIAPLITF